MKRVTNYQIIDKYKLLFVTKAKFTLYTENQKHVNIHLIKKGIYRIYNLLSNKKFR